MLSWSASTLAAAGETYDNGTSELRGKSWIGHAERQQILVMRPQEDQPDQCLDRGFVFPQSEQQNNPEKQSPKCGSQVQKRHSRSCYDEGHDRRFPCFLFIQ